jgi:hypothetical protein
MDDCPLWVLCVLSVRGLCDELITRPEESYRLWCVLVCDLGTSRMRRFKLIKGCKCRIEKKNTCSTISSLLCLIQARKFARKVDTTKYEGTKHNIVSLINSVFYSCAPVSVVLDIVAAVATWTCWTARGSNPSGGEFFRTRPDRPWGPSSVLFIG